MSVLAERVSAGVNLLTVHFGGEANWIDQINLRVLDLASTENCILGQLFADYFAGKRVLNLDSEDSNGYGFVCDGEYYDDDELKEHWETVINEMRLDRLRAALTDTPALSEALTGDPWRERGEGVITSAAAQPIEFAVSTVSEADFIHAARRGVVDLYLCATGRPETDRVLVNAMIFG